jgi:hypothetical protein
VVFAISCQVVLLGHEPPEPDQDRQPDGRHPDDLAFAGRAARLGGWLWRSSTARRLLGGWRIR